MLAVLGSALPSLLPHKRPGGWVPLDTPQSGEKSKSNEKVLNCSKKMSILSGLEIENMFSFLVFCRSLKHGLTDRMPEIHDILSAKVLEWVLGKNPTCNASKGRVAMIYLIIFNAFMEIDRNHTNHEHKYGNKTYSCNFCSSMLVHLHIIYIFMYVLCFWWILHDIKLIVGSTCKLPFLCFQATVLAPGTWS